MPDYNLNALNHLSFEQIVQVIAKKGISSGVTLFGDRPDGGREATFNSKMNYPSTTAPWEGYLIIQPKFKLRPAGSHKDDGDWPIEKLNKDLSHLRAKPMSNLREILACSEDLLVSQSDDIARLFVIGAISNSVCRVIID
jgi:hypothetical protein